MGIAVAAAAGLVGAAGDLYAAQTTVVGQLLGHGRVGAGGLWSEEFAGPDFVPSAEESAALLGVSIVPRHAELADDAGTGFFAASDLGCGEV